MQASEPHIPDFILLTTGRSGSTYLDSLLDSHPDIHSASELLGTSPIAPGDPERELEEAFERIAAARAKTDKPVFGFKLPWAILKQGSTLPLALFERGTRCVALHRKNRLDKLVSLKLAQLNGPWSWRSREHYEQQRLVINIPEMLAMLSGFERADEILMEMSRGWPRVVSSYEAIVADPDSPWVQDFLGVPIRPLVAQTLRARTGTLRETICNYDEVAAALAGTPYARFLDEEAPLGFSGTA